MLGLVDREQALQKSLQNDIKENPMNFYPLFIPAASMILLTLLVWVFMYFKRLCYVIKHGILADELATPDKIDKLLPDHVNAPSNNLKNLFEMPILFYVITFIAASIPDHSIISNLAAWSFLFFRVIHSVIHCLNGKVLPRFIVYILSTLALITLTINVVTQLFNQVS